MTDSKPSGEKLLAASLLFGVLGKTLYRELERDDLDCLIETQVFTEVPFGEEQADTQAAVSVLSFWTDKNAAGLSQDALDDIRHDYFYLFAGVGRPLASPWESTYFNDARVTFEKQTLEVRDWYRRSALMIERKNREPDDNIGYELSFIAHLAQLAYEASEVGEIGEYQRLVQSLRDFLAEHPLRWAFVWAQRVGENARSQFYLGIAQLVSGSLRALALELGIDLRGIKQCAMPVVLA
jgi:TorA maturation chaperone TorD